MSPIRTVRSDREIDFVSTQMLLVASNPVNTVQMLSGSRLTRSMVPYLPSNERQIALPPIDRLPQETSAQPVAHISFSNHYCRTVLHLKCLEKQHQTWHQHRRVTRGVCQRTGHSPMKLCHHCLWQGPYWILLEGRLGRSIPKSQLATAETAPLSCPTKPAYDAGMAGSLSAQSEFTQNDVPMTT